MSDQSNKQIIQHAFDALATGDRTPFAALMADDFSWTIIGTNKWSGTYRGLASVRDKLFRPLFERFADRYTNRALRILGDGDFVVVECRGRVTTKTGKPYNNEYCYVIRMADGKMRELTEYCDTELVAAALQRGVTMSAHEPGAMRIGQLARRTGRSVHAIRWYESQGLIPGVRRNVSGHRVYTSRHVSWLELMDRLRRTGMSIARMRQYTALVSKGKGSLRAQREMLDEHRHFLQERQSELQRALELIERKLEFYDEWIETGRRPEKE